MCRFLLLPYLCPYLLQVLLLRSCSLLLLLLRQSVLIHEHVEQLAFLLLRLLLFLPLPDLLFNLSNLQIVLVGLLLVLVAFGFSHALDRPASLLDVRRSTSLSDPFALLLLFHQELRRHYNLHI